MYRQLECGGSSLRKQEDANVPRDGNVHGPEDLQRLLMIVERRGLQWIVRVRSRRMLMSSDSRSYQRISILIPRGETRRHCSLSGIEMS